MQDIQKNGKSKDVVRVQIKEFKGWAYLDIRTFYQGDDGEYCPTKKGISIPIQIAQDVVSAAQREIQ